MVQNNKIVPLNLMLDMKVFEFHRKNFRPFPVSKLKNNNVKSKRCDANQAMVDTDGWNEGLKEDIKYKKFISTNFISISRYIRASLRGQICGFLACYRILRVTLVSE